MIKKLVKGQHWIIKHPYPKDITMILLKKSQREALDSEKSQDQRKHDAAKNIYSKGGIIL